MHLIAGSTSDLLLVEVGGSAHETGMASRVIEELAKAGWGHRAAQALLAPTRAGVVTGCAVVPLCHTQAETGLALDFAGHPRSRHKLVIGDLNGKRYVMRKQHERPTAGHLRLSCDCSQGCL